MITAIRNIHLRGLVGGSLVSSNMRSSISKHYVTSVMAKLINFNLVGCAESICIDYYHLRLLLPMNKRFPEEGLILYLALVLMPTVVIYLHMVYLVSVDEKLLK
ncbi:hypothetical protein GQX74_008249 [Glossina fuscipes]|nr:hypothetical protein GQX74_008249 [Glossina fuscipes]